MPTTITIMGVYIVATSELAIEPVFTTGQWLVVQADGTSANLSSLPLARTGQTIVDIVVSDEESQPGASVVFTHETGAWLAPIITFSISEAVTVASMSTAALAQFVTDDTGETAAASGSQAALSQSAAEADPATGTKQDEIKALLAARAVSMNDDLVPTELNLIHFDTYDGVMHPKRSWETEKDYSDPEWAIKLLITDLDVTTVLKQVDGEAESAVLVSIPSLTVEFESEIEFLGCPPIAGLGFAVVAIKDGKYETIAKGECNVENRGEVT